MNAQTLIVALLVIGCSLHAAWRLLLPAALRRSLAARLLNREPPPSAGCDSGCDGCGSAGKAAPPASAAKPLVFHPRRER